MFCSFSSYDSILLLGNIWTNSAIGSWMVKLRVVVPHTISKCKRGSIIIWLHLTSATLALINSLDTCILGIQPCSLNISLLLRIITLWVYFTTQITDQLCSLLLKWSIVTTSLLIESLLVVLYCLLSCLSWSSSEVVLSGSVEESLVMIVIKAIDHSPKASLSTSNWSTNFSYLIKNDLLYQAQLSDVILMDHSHNWLLLHLVDFRILKLILLWCHEFSLIVLLWYVNLQIHHQG